MIIGTLCVVLFPSQAFFVVVVVLQFRFSIRHGKWRAAKKGDGLGTLSPDVDMGGQKVGWCIQQIYAQWIWD